jgi:hypothetical protein
MSRPAQRIICSILAIFLLTSVWAQPKAELRRPANNPLEAERQGRELVAELLRQQPQPSTNIGVLKIRPKGNPTREVSLRIEVVVTPTNWFSIYEAGPSDLRDSVARLTVIHTEASPNQYLLKELSTNDAPRALSGSETMVSFAGSDFWVADLGLEFLHWPVQNLLRKELRLSQSCNVLESINPNAAPGGYARVIAWIDIENGAIIHADAYDSNKELIKQFAPTELKKVNGQKQVEEMEMRNRRNGSRSWVKFNLEA